MGKNALRRDSEASSDDDVAQYGTDVSGPEGRRLGKFVSTPTVVKTTTKQVLTKNEDGVTHNVEEEVRNLGTGEVMFSTQEHKINNPLLEAVSANLQSPIGNHTLQRSFRPWLEALFGPDIKNLPSPAKQQKLSVTSDTTSSSALEIPHVLQGEIARLDQKFKVSLDLSSQNGTKLIKLVCCLDSQHLLCVPPVSVVIPDDYPYSAPSCKLIEQVSSALEYASCKPQSILKTKLIFQIFRLFNAWISIFPFGR